MGIKNLLKFLNTHPDLVEDKNITDISGKKIAIDISILLYQVVISVRNSGADLVNKKGEITSHVLGLFNKTVKLLNKGIIPVYVFDGKPPEIKRKVLDLRKNIRKKAEEKLALAESNEDKIKYFKRSVIITKKQLQDCRDLLDYMGVPYINAPEEADSQCAWLAKNGYVDAVLTEDMDILTFGSPFIIRNLTSFKRNPVQISLEKIKTKFGWTQKEFIQFCILLGCDYCDHITDTNCFEMFDHFQESRDIDIVLKKLGKVINYDETFKYFENPKIDDTIQDLTVNNPDLTKLNKCLVEEHGLIKYKIQKKMNLLILAYTNLNCIPKQSSFSNELCV